MKKFLIQISLIFIFLICIEFSIRLIKNFGILNNIFDRMLVYTDIKKIAGSFHEFDESIGHTLLSNFEGEFENRQVPGTTYKISTNSYRLRGEENDLQDKQSKRVLFIGDSFTLGLYVNNNETIPENFKNFFIEKFNKKIQVFNAGYTSGFCPDQHYLWLKNKIKLFKPHLVIYNFYIGNDMDCIKKINWFKTDSNGLPLKIKFNNIEIKNGYIHDKKENSFAQGQNFCFSISTINQSYIYVTFCRFLEKLFRDDAPYERFEHIKYKYSNPKMLKDEKNLKLIIEGMKKVSNQHNSHFLVINIPHNHQVFEKFSKITLKGYSKDDREINRYYFNELSKDLKNIKINSHDIIDDFKKSSLMPYPQNGEPHLNKIGNKLAAKSILNYLEDNKEYYNLLFK